MAADLVSRRVAVIAAGDTTAALAVKAETATIPIVFGVGFDAVRAGLVASINRPGGNLTGVSSFLAELSGKQVGLLRDLVPKAVTIAALVDPSLLILGPAALRDTRDAAAALGQKLLVLEASTADEIDAQFARLDQEPADAMLVPPGPFFVTRAGQIVALPARHRIPAIYPRREFVEAGGLMSYGSKLAKLFSEMGRYAGRILNGEKLADLPVIRETKLELVINLKAAKAINFEIPLLMRALADEVIE
jgi:putative ABC transport system substrate-binding protein